MADTVTCVRCWLPADRLLEGAHLVVVPGGGWMHQSTDICVVKLRGAVRELRKHAEQLTADHKTLGDEEVQYRERQNAELAAAKERAKEAEDRTQYWKCKLDAEKARAEKLRLEWKALRALLMGVEVDEVRDTHEWDYSGVIFDRVRKLHELVSKTYRFREVLTYLPYYGCLTGDCPHETANDCLKAIKAEAERISAIAQAPEETPDMGLIEVSDRHAAMTFVPGRVLDDTHYALHVTARAPDQPDITVRLNPRQVMRLFRASMSDVADKITALRAKNAHLREALEELLDESAIRTRIQRSNHGKQYGSGTVAEARARAALAQSDTKEA